MGCWQSSLSAETHPEKDQNNHQNQQPHNRNPPFSGGSEAVPAAEFLKFSFTDLKAATKNFSSEFIVSESGEKAPNLVYKGQLQDSRWIAVKKFSKVAWPDPKQFAEEAKGVGKLRFRRLANLIGYCCDGDERLLVAEYMPNDTLAMHLFHLLGKRADMADGAALARLVASRSVTELSGAVVSKKRTADEAGSSKKAKKPKREKSKEPRSEGEKKKKKKKEKKEKREKPILKDEQIADNLGDRTDGGRTEDLEDEGSERQERIPDPLDGGADDEDDFRVPLEIAPGVMSVARGCRSPIKNKMTEPEGSDGWATLDIRTYGGWTAADDFGVPRDSFKAFRIPADDAYYNSLSEEKFHERLIRLNGEATAINAQAFSRFRKIRKDLELANQQSESARTAESQARELQRIAEENYGRLKKNTDKDADMFTRKVDSLESELLRVKDSKVTIGKELDQLKDHLAQREEEFAEKSRADKELIEQLQAGGGSYKDHVKAFLHSAGFQEFLKNKTAPGYSLGYEDAANFVLKLEGIKREEKHSITAYVDFLEEKAREEKEKGGDPTAEGECSQPPASEPPPSPIDPVFELTLNDIYELEGVRADKGGEGGEGEGDDSTTSTSDSGDDEDDGEDEQSDHGEENA